MTKLPRVVLIGRTNVGKSTLFNRLTDKVKSITFDQAGVTRDFLQDTVCWQNACFTLIDTGGLQIKKSRDPIYERVSSSVLEQLEQADLMIFVVDSSVGLMPDEIEFAKLLHKLGKPVILVLNKYDVKDASEQRYTFERLGFKDVCPVSAQHGLGVADMLDVLVEMLPVKISKLDMEEPLKVAIIGKPNVGKSSLLNALVKQERAIVSPEAGTTREAITERVSFYREDIAITDTPGVRRKRGVLEPLEQLMVKRALQALKHTDIALLVIDASEGTISDQELKLAFYAFEHHKGLIVLFNKYDLVDEETQQELEFSLAPYDFFLKKIQTMRISCLTGKNVGKLLSIIKDVADRFKMRIPDDELTKLFREALQRRKLYHQGQPLIFRNAKQVKSGPMTIVLYVNEPSWFGQSQLGYLDNVIRKAYNLEGVPVKFIPRK